MLFAGFKGGGKTTALTALSAYLTSKGKKIASIKNARKGNVEITKKDSWLHFLSGANPAVLISPDLLIIHEKVTENTLDQLLAYFEEKGLDYLLVEGLYKELAGRKDLVTVVCAKNERELDELLSLHQDARVITGMFSSKGFRDYKGIPVYDIKKDVPKIAQLITQD
ncbi:MAG: molybdopterin-guanine dinucleotide biosynthesis protein MobB [Conexivisphaerales archaeon]